MKSKQEVFHSVVGFDGVATKFLVMEAMDEYAKEVATEFANFMGLHDAPAVQHMYSLFLKEKLLTQSLTQK